MSPAHEASDQRPRLADIGLGGRRQYLAAGRLGRRVVLINHNLSPFRRAGDSL
jgi:hypothetical protein